jgi:hypothetical protein
LKKLEVKSVGITSMGKATIYMMLIPTAIILIIGLFTVFIGLLISEREVAIIGGMYSFIAIVMLGLYGAISMLCGATYNWLASKFGGLEITLSESLMAEADIPDNDAGPDEDVTIPTND